MIDLNTIWFILISILLTGYIILDGFDFGAGSLFLFFKSNRERGLFIAAIAPVWDGNEVWLLTAGGALFAAFPSVYAAVFSGFYVAFVLLLVCLIFRAVSMEFRGKVDSPIWRAVWDWSFGFCSILPPVLLGTAFGNILRGVPIDASGNCIGNFFTVLNPYSFVAGFTTLTLFTMHGALYLLIKTENDLHERLKRWALNAWTAFIVLYVVIICLTFFTAARLFQNFFSPLPLFLLAGSIFALVLIPVFMKAGKFFKAFVSSSVAAVCVFNFFTANLYPSLVPSKLNTDYSLTIYNTASTPKSLTAMLIIALIGMPIVIAYTIYIYRVFKGKVDHTDMQY